MGTWWSRGGREETQEMENKKGGCYSTPPTQLLIWGPRSKHVLKIFEAYLKDTMQNFCTELCRTGQIAQFSDWFFSIHFTSRFSNKKVHLPGWGNMILHFRKHFFSSNKCATAQPSLVGSVESQTKVDLFSRVGTLGHTSTSFVPLLLQFCTHITTSAFDPTDLIQMCWYIFVCHPACHRCFVCCIFRSYLTLKGQERHRLIKQTCWDHDRIWYFFLIILQKVIFICITSTSMSEVHLNPHKGQRGRLWFQYLIFLPNNLHF